MPPDFKALFTNPGQSASYASFRPDYQRHCPQAFDTLLAYARAPSPPLPPFVPDLAVDIATGTGQAITPLAQVFKSVIGLDASASQLANAIVLPNVEYKVGDAESTGLADGSADLMTVCQALHWLDRPRFYAEAVRVLKPGGVLAIITYDFGVLLLPGAPVPPRPASPGSTARAPDPALDPGSSALQQLWEGLYRGTLGPYWTAPRALVDEQYRSLEPLEPLFQDVTRVQLDMSMDTDPQQLVGYVRSWSAYVDYKKVHPEGEDPADRFEAQLLAALQRSGGGGGGSHSLHLVQTLTLIMGRKA